MNQFQFQDINVSVTPTNDTKQWFMTVEQVAEAYGKEPNSIIQTIGRHSDEIRDGLEKGVTICHTLGGPQQHTILYRDGVIKLGFFIRGPRAAAFRQFATDLIMSHMGNTGYPSSRDFSQFMDKLTRVETTCNNMSTKFDYLIGMDLTVFGTDAPVIKELIEKTSRKTGMSHPEVWGLIRRECDVSSYKMQNRRIINFLKNILGEGIKLVKEEQ